MKLVDIEITGFHHIKGRTTYQLKDMNYLYGLNGSGKSTVLQAVQLALLGYIPGTDKTKSAIFRHANGNRMSVCLDMSDGDCNYQIQRTWKKSGTNIAYTEVVDPEDLDLSELVSRTELPVFNFSSFIGLSSNKLKEWFMSFLPASGGEIEWEHLFTGAIQDEFPKVLDEDLVDRTVSAILGSGHTGLQSAVWADNYLKELISSTKTEYDRAHKTIQSLVHYEDSTSWATMSELNTRYQELTQQRDELKLMLSHVLRNEVIARSIDQLNLRHRSIEEDDDYPDWSDTLHRTEINIAECEQSKQSLVDQARTLQQEIDTTGGVVNGRGVCPYTNTECGNIVDSMEHYKMLLETATQRLESIKGVLSSVDSNISHLTRKKQQLVSQMAGLESRYNELSNLRTGYHSDVAGMSQERVQQMISDVDSQLSECVQMKLRVAANDEYNRLYTVLNSQQAKSSQNLEILKVWRKITGVNGIQSQIMLEPFEALKFNMNKILSTMFSSSCSAEFVIDERPNSFEFGLIRDDTYTSFELLSSGEKCMYSLALLISLAAESELPLIMVDDSLDHLDPVMIQRVFESLYKVPGVQVLLAGVQKCGHPNKSEFVIEVSR